MDKLNQIESLFNQAKENGEKFYSKKNKAAGTRLRANLLDIRNLCNDLRKEVSATKNEL